MIWMKMRAHDIQCSSKEQARSSRGPYPLAKRDCKLDCLALICLACCFAFLIPICGTWKQIIWHQSLSKSCQPKYIMLIHNIVHFEKKTHPSRRSSGWFGISHAHKSRIQLWAEFSSYKKFFSQTPTCCYLLRHHFKCQSSEFKQWGCGADIKKTPRTWVGMFTSAEVEGEEKGKYDSLKERDLHGVSQHLIKRGEEEDGCSVWHSPSII